MDILDQWDGLAPRAPAGSQGTWVHLYCGKRELLPASSSLTFTRCHSICAPTHIYTAHDAPHPHIHTIKLNYKWTNTLMYQIYRETGQFVSTSWSLLFLLVVPPLSSTSRCRHRVCNASVSRGLGKGGHIEEEVPGSNPSSLLSCVYADHILQAHKSLAGVN